MVKRTLPILALALGAAAAVALVSCGGGSDKGLLPGQTASEIVANLDSVDELAAGGDCTSAAAAASDVRDQIDNLPDSVDPQLRENLAKGALRLESVSQDCLATTTETTELPEPTTSETSTTEESSTTTKQTTTKPETTTTTSTQSTTTPPTQPTTTPGTGGVGAGGKITGDGN